MKSFTKKEREAAVSWIEVRSADELSVMSSDDIVNALFNEINNAEGMPDHSDDKYIVAKDEIQFSLNALNSSITDAVRLGMVVTIADTSKQLPPVQVAYPPSAPAPMYPGAPAITKPWTPVPKFALERIYKDF